jgi:stage II sporulation protein AA (anti-sigma F factor antagonist)
MEPHTNRKEVVLTLKGTLMGGLETKALDERIRKLIQKGVRYLILDLSKVRWVNGSGIGCLVGALQRFRAVNGSLKLVNPAPKIKRLIEMTNLSSVFEITNTMDAYAGLTP